MVATLQRGFGPRKPIADQQPDLNSVLAQLFEEIADRLASRSTSDFRIRRYRQGATALRDLLVSVEAIYIDSGRAGLDGIPGLGQSLALSVERFLTSGHMPVLDRLRELTAAETINIVHPPVEFQPLPVRDSVGTFSQLRPGSASSISGNSSTATDVRYDSAIKRNSSPLSPQFDHSSRGDTAPTAKSHRASVSNPLVGELLSLDAEYRRRAAADELVKVAPRPFNPSGTAWLPLMHAMRGDRRYSVAWSSTEHAHEAGMVGDWVIIRRDVAGHRHQWTVITSHFGRLSGRRLIRGLEAECLQFYHEHPQAVSASELFVQDALHQRSLFDRNA